MADAKWWPTGMPARVSTTVGFTTFALNGSTDQWEVIFQMPEDAILTTASFRYGLRTGTPPTYKISLQGVDASGNPDGTIKGGGTPASATFTPPADATWNSTWQSQIFANSYAAARGEYLALVIAYDSGTVDGSNNSTFTVGNTMAGIVGFPYSISNDAGSRTRSANYPCFSVASASKVYGMPSLAAVAQSITTTTEAALKFTLTSGISSTFQVVGAQFLLSALAAGQTLTMTLYDGGGASDTTPLQIVTLDSDYISANGTRFISIPFDEATLSTLTIGNSYRLSLICSSGTNTLQGLTVNAAADWDAWSGGQQFALSTRSGGNWTDTTTSRPFIELILADLTGGGGGSSIAFPVTGRIVG